MHLKVDIRFQKLTCLITDDESSPDEPYMWIFFMRLDGSTVTQVSTAPPRLAGQVVVQSGPGSHGNLGVSDVSASATNPIDIPAAIGAYSSTLRPIRIEVNGDIIFLPGRIVAVVALLEEDASPADEVIDNAHASVRTLVQLRINDFINTLDPNELVAAAQARMATAGGSLRTNVEAILNERIDAIVEQIRGQIRSVIETEFLIWHTPGAFWELFGFADPDDRIGNRTFRFNERTLVRDPGQMNQALHDSLQRVDGGVIKSLYELDGRLDAVLVREPSDVERTGDTSSRSVAGTGVHVFDEPRLCIEAGERAEWTLWALAEEESFLFRYPFLEPVWTIEGTELVGSSGQVSVRVTSGIPAFDPKTPGRPVYTNQERIATIGFTKFSVGQLDGIRLKNTPADGRYGVMLDVSVKLGGSVSFPVASHMVSFDGLAVESPFYDRFDACMEKFARVGEKYAESKMLSPKDLWGPSSRRRWFEEQMQIGRALVAAGELTSDQMRRVERALLTKLRLSAR